MADGQKGLEELEQEIKRIIEDNRKFLKRVMDEEFDPVDELGGDEETEEFEEL